MEYKISIIIPVFNVEDYIKEALDSVIRQSIGFDHLEVIMVDDCSTDKSGEIMDYYANKHENFKAIHLPENSGFAGKPRNVGIQHATGEYLMFLDPDDYYSDDACEILYEKIEKENADIVFGKFSILFENGRMIDASSWYPVYSTSFTEIKNVKTDNKELLYKSPPSIMTKIFKREFIENNDISSPEGIPGEDLVFAAHCFLKTDNIIYINRNVLVIRKRETKNKSVTFIINDKYINGSIKAYSHIYQICKDNDKEEEFPLIMENRFPFWFNQFILSNLTTSEKKKALKSIRPLLKEYHKSGLSLPSHLMPVFNCIINKKFDDAILLIEKLTNSQNNQEKSVYKVINQKNTYKKISIILTALNAQKRIKKTILSVLNTIYSSEIELIVVDGGSNDNTVTIVEKIIKKHDNLILIKPENNGENLSKLRNMGIHESNGKYILFLDNNMHYLNVDNLFRIVEHANLHNLDCINGHIKIVNNDNQIELANKIDCENQNQTELIKKILAQNDSLLDILIRKDFIIQNKVFFNENFNYSCDNIFLADLFVCKPKIKYYNSYIYKKYDNFSTKEEYKYKDLYEQINSWELTEKTLKKIDISYNELKLPLEVKKIIYSLIFHSNGNISKNSFNKLNLFFNENLIYLNKLVLPDRYELIFNSILKNDYEKFVQLSKKRLLVVGQDLKFIEPALNYFKGDYNIKIDEWTGENSHDEQISTRLLNWTDIILCEWLLGNAVWYSQRKMDHQRLIIRAHKYELSRNFGNQVDYENVNGVIAISYYFLELFSNVFKIPRQKMIMLSNYIETSIYTGEKTGDFKHNLAIVGYIPRWKGLIKGLEILKMLKENDEKFKLYLMGKHYKEVDWVWNNPKERSYFEECEKYIQENNLKDSVIFQGWTERSQMFNKIGYILSVSDIEGSHQSPAEGLVDKTLAFIINWEGAEYVYPKEIIFDNLNDIKDMILYTHDNDHQYQKLLKKMRSYVINEFSLEKFIIELKNTLNKL